MALELRRRVGESRPAGLGDGGTERAQMQNRSEGGQENYADLIARVESEVYRDQSIPKGQINVNAEFGTIVLHGYVDDEQQKQRIEQAVRGVPGVKDVVSYLHLEGTPAPQEQPPRHGELGTLPS